MHTENKANPKTILSIAALYSLGHFLLLTTRGFWSDGHHLITYIHDGNYPLIWAHLGQFKSYALYYTIHILLALGGNMTVLVKEVGFFSWLVAGVALYILLRTVIALSDRDSFFLSSSYLLIASFPFKGELAYLHFSLANMLFLLGCLAYFRAQTTVQKTYRYLTYFLTTMIFLASFTTNSILVFYGGFLVIDLTRFGRDQRDSYLRIFFNWFKKRIFWIALPIGYWIYQGSLGKAYGEFGEGYNQFVILKSGFLSTYFDNVWSYIAYGFFWPLLAPIAILQRRIFAGIAFLTFPVVYGITNYIAKHDTSGQKTELAPRRYMLWGLFWYSIAAFPYLAVGDYPTIFGDGFHMRYAILLPLGSSLIILGALRGLVAKKWQRTAQATLLSLFIVFNIYNYFSLDMDWYRKKATVLSVRDTESVLINNATTLVFHDDYEAQKNLDRHIKTGEYTLYLHEALYPNSFTFGIAANDIKTTQSVEDAVREQYGRFERAGIYSHPKDFDPVARIQDVSIQMQAPYEVNTVRTWLSLKKEELFSDTTSFEKALKEKLQIEVIPITPSVPLP